MEGREPARTETDAATAENLNRLAKLLSNGAPVNLKLNGRRISLPDDASLTIDLERDPETGCAEVDIRWPRDRWYRVAWPTAGRMLTIVRPSEL